MLKKKPSTKAAREIEVAKLVCVQAGTNLSVNNLILSNIDTALSLGPR